MKSKVFKNKKIVIASHNKGKIKEIRELLEPLDIDILSSADFNLQEPVEDGYSFNLFINRIGRDNLINSDDPEVEDLILKIDEEIYQTNKLLEKHILENFFMIDDFDMEKEPCHCHSCLGSYSQWCQKNLILLR